MATQAHRYLQQGSRDRFMEARRVSGDDLKAYVDIYVSEANRDGSTGCPMAAYAGEICRQGREIQDLFTEGLEGMINALEATLPGSLTADEARRKAITLAVTMVGAVTLARASRHSPALSDEILSSVRQELLGEGS
ncbi:hypothetical protein [Pseudomonas batumici]|uniref:Transcriptional regulator, TetR family n=1 Tax=Pseudomonas batumici TaxID=226910 RepID=A0A0C2E9H7_9PSED|nr:hypothetical protein [Pseudomonas batumici]KIH82529.1 Transcriptional regulator, TetR family [Pseudomonas batumici]